MTNAKKHKEEYVKSYQKSGQVKHYHGIFKYKSDKIIHKLEASIILREIRKLKQRNSYLDIACGFGRITKIIEGKFKNAYGADTSRKMMSIAKKNCRKVVFKVGDAEKLPFKKDSFDFETCFRFIMNFKKPVRQRMLRDFSRVLKPKGTLVLNIHRNKHGFRGIYSTLRNLFLGTDEPYLSYFEAKEQLRKAGFRISRVYGIKLIPYWRGKIFFPEKLLLPLEKVFARVPLLKYFADGLIIIARKE